MSPDEQQLLVETIKEALTVNYNRNTIRAYREDLLAFYGVKLEQITIEQVLSVTSKKAAEYRDRMMAAGLANATIRRRLTFVRKFYKFLHRKGCIPHNPIEFVQLPNSKEDEIVVTPLSDTEMQTLLGMPSQTWKGRRIYTLIVFGLAFGLRRAELARISTGHFQRNATTNLLQFKIAVKGGKQRTCVLSPSVEGAMYQWVKIRSDYNGPLFPASRLNPHKPMHPDAIGALITALAARAKIQSHLKSASDRRKSGRWKVGAHTLRATFIYQQYKAGIPIDVIAEMVGHESPEVTWRYLKRIERDHQNLVSTSCDSFITATLNRSGIPSTDRL